MSYRRLKRFNKKAPTSEKPPYIIFNPHTLEPLLPSESVNKDYHVTTVATLDPGIKNCGIRIATLDHETRQVKTCIQIKCDFTHESLNKKENLGSDTSYYVNTFRVLDPYIEYFRWCHYIVVESQMAINYDLVRMAQNIITYLMLRVENMGFRPLIIEIDNHLKSRMLNAPPKMKKPQLKKWCKERAIKELEARGDNATTDMIRKAPKGDDHGDTVCYEIVWFMMLSQGFNRPPLPDPQKHVEPLPLPLQPAAQPLQHAAQQPVQPTEQKKSRFVTTQIVQQRQSRFVSSNK